MFVNVAIRITNSNVNGKVSATTFAGGLAVNDYYCKNLSLCTYFQFAEVSSRPGGYGFWGLPR